MSARILMLKMATRRVHGQLHRHAKVTFINFLLIFSLASNQQKYCMVIQYIDNCSCLPLKKLTRNLEFSENNINRCKTIIIIGTTSDTNVMLRILKFRAISVRIPVFLGLTLGPQYDGLNLEKHD